MARENLRATILGFLGAFAVFALLFYFAGVDKLVDTLQMADYSIVALVVVATLAWLVAWSFALRTVLGVLGVELSLAKSFFVFSGAMFSNNITPFGQAGGEPVTAYLISRSADAEYETSLAAIASVDTLNFVPSITIALVGAAYYASEITLGTNRDLLLALVVVVVLAVTVPAAAYLAWQRRYRLESRAVSAFTPAVRTVAKYVPRVPVPTEEGIERRVNGFFRAIERIATNPRGLALALGASTFGWFCQMVGLWLAFRAIGVPIPLSVAMLVVPIGAIAGVTPLPGGAGGIETVLVALLLAAPLPAVTKSIAAAAVVVFRGAVYWVPTLLGGGVMGWISLRSSS
ncbi:lysylphosphatidylglycerol synthase transmembrane domain-containing protein [Halogeometricum pallidum]|nr:lysylphosphatidylglycerol synthase transmembrane domain-containing protein [Halogeometricum pallidum]